MLLVHNELDLDSMDPGLLSQLPLQSDIERASYDEKEENNKNNAEKMDLLNEDDDDTDDTDLDVSKRINKDSTEKPWYHQPKNWLKLNLVFFLLALLISGLSQPKMLWNLVKVFLEWMENHIVGGSFAFISLYILCDLLMLPCLVFTMGAGFVYCNVLHSMLKGLFLSTFIVFVSELIGSTIAFLTARYVLRKTIKKMAAKYPKFVLLDAAVKKHGFKVTLLFRMSPVTPYNLLNYFMGLTSVRLMDYSCASIGILPNFFICCLIGGSLHHIYQLSQIDITKNIPLLIITVGGIVFVICLIFYVTRLIRRELAKIAIQMKQEQDILSTTDDENHPLTEHDPDLHKYNNCDPSIISYDDISISIDMSSAADPLYQ